MASVGNTTAASPPSPPPSPPPPAASSGGSDWKERILLPTLLGGIVGGGAGSLSKHRKVHGIANLCATYATNLAVVTGCYCGAREFVRETRASDPDDLINSAIGGLTSGALLGRLQGGQLGALRYSIVFAVVGTALDFATLQLKPLLKSYVNPAPGEDTQQKTANSGWSLPEWSPIQVLDEEALAAKRAREQRLHTQRTLGKLNKEES